MNQSYIQKTTVKTRINAINQKTAISLAKEFVQNHPHNNPTFYYPELSNNEQKITQKPYQLPDDSKNTTDVLYGYEIDIQQTSFYTENKSHGDSQSEDYSVTFYKKNKKPYFNPDNEPSSHPLLIKTSLASIETNETSITFDKSHILDSIIQSCETSTTEQIYKKSINPTIKTKHLADTKNNEYYGLLIKQNIPDENDFFQLSRHHLPIECVPLIVINTKTHNVIYNENITINDHLQKKIDEFIIQCTQEILNININDKPSNKKALKL